MIKVKFFNTPITILKPTIKTKKGVKVKEYKDFETILCSFRTFGGTESNSNGLTVVENTAVIDTWYNPNITSNCNVKTLDGQIYEIIGTPENIENRNLYMRFKIKAVKGGA